MAFVNFPLFDNGTAFSDLTVFVCDFFLGSYPFSCFVIKYASGGNLDVRFGKQFPFAEYEVDVVVGLAFVVVQSRYTFHSVLLSELIRKFFKHLLRRKGGINLRQGDYQLPCFDTFSLCSASQELLLAFPGEIVPKAIVCGTIGGIKVFLFGVARDI